MKVVGLIFGARSALITMASSSLSRYRLRLQFFTVTLLLAIPEVAAAEGFVTNATEADLDAALVGGGVVIFQCDGAIPITGTKVINRKTFLNASGRKITITPASGSVQIFNVPSNSALSLVSLTVSRGTSIPRPGNPGGGAIYVNPGGALIASNCVFSQNRVLGTDAVSGVNGTNGTYARGQDGSNGGPAGNGFGGAIYTAGIATLTSCTFSNNTAGGGSGGKAGSGGNGGVNSTSAGGKGGSGGSGGDGIGGAIYNAGTLSLNFCTFAGNVATGGPGGVGGNGGQGNDLGGAGGSGGAGGQGLGGALFSSNGVSVQASTFVGNQANGGVGGYGGDNAWGRYGTGVQGNGGAGGKAAGSSIYSAGKSVITQSTFYLNNCTGGDGDRAGWNLGNPNFPANGAKGGNGGSAFGGGIFVTSTNSTVNCTFYSNSLTAGNGGPGQVGTVLLGKGGSGGSAGGGGIYSLSYTGVTNSTFSSCAVTPGLGGSTANGGSAGAAGTNNGTHVTRASGIFWLKNSILGNNATPANSFGVTDAGNNICSDKTLAKLLTTTRTNTDPKIDFLRDNSGPTRTCALLRNSPAINAGDDSAAPSLDQRGFLRSGISDVGAFEFNSPSQALGITGARLNGKVLILDGTNGILGRTYYVLTSTNLAQPPNLWIAVATNVLTVNGTFTITTSNAVDPNASQQFFRLKTQ